MAIAVGRHDYCPKGLIFLSEYGNLGDGGNHVRCGCRDLEGDFGEGLLAQHYRNEAHQQEQGPLSPAAWKAELTES